MNTFDLEIEKLTHIDEFFERCILYRKSQKNALNKLTEAFRSTLEPNYIRYCRMKYLESRLEDAYNKINILRDIKKDKYPDEDLVLISAGKNKMFLLDDGVKQIQSAAEKWYNEHQLLVRNDNDKKTEIYNKRIRLVERCKKIPIENLLQSEIIINGDRKKTLCPIHNEDTPSFFIFENNSYHCFGCQAHGSNAIDFVIEWKGLDFNGALDYLRNK